jgi:CubicO group peptidase (beta-lactamase class C family)
VRDHLAPPRAAAVALPAGILGAASLLTLALSGTACAPASAPPSKNAGLEAAFSSLDAFVARTMREEGTPGLALAITDRDRLLRVSTYGFADIGARVALRPEHLFQIGSISKSFTALCLLQERDAGRFDPRKPISVYLPWFRVHTKYAPITGHHLLSHTAGIPGDRDDIPPSTISYEAWALRERRTGYPPGVHYAYSNIGFQVLGCALSEIAGETYANIVRKRIFEPLGMSASVASMTHDLYPRLAVGYRTLYDDRPSRPSHPLLPAPWEEYNWGDGGVASTPADLAAYLRMLLNRGAGPQGRIVSEEGFKLLIQRAIPMEGGWYYGNGMSVREEQGRTIIGHSGGMLGFSSMLLGDLDEGVGTVVFVNGPGEPRTVAEYALSVVRAVRRGQEIPPLPPEDVPARIPKAPEYAGEFVSPGGGKLLLEAEGEQLLLLHEGRRIALERQEGEDAFLVDHPDFALFPLRFGRAGGFVVEAFHGPRWYPNARYAGPRRFQVPPAWTAYPGHYRCTNHWEPNIRVILRKGNLWLVTPEGEERALTPAPGGIFRVGNGKYTADELRFDAVLHGQALRANLSGVDYFRAFTP